MSSTGVAGVAIDIGNAIVHRAHLQQGSGFAGEPKFEDLPKPKLCFSAVLQGFARLSETGVGRIWTVLKSASRWEIRDVIRTVAATNKAHSCRALIKGHTPALTDIPGVACSRYTRLAAAAVRPL